MPQPKSLPPRMFMKRASRLPVLCSEVGAYVCNMSAVCHVQYAYGVRTRESRCTATYGYAHHGGSSMIESCTTCARSWSNRGRQFSRPGRHMSTGADTRNRPYGREKSQAAGESARFCRRRRERLRCASEFFFLEGTLLLTYPAALPSSCLLRSVLMQNVSHSCRQKESTATWHHSSSPVG